MKKKKHKPLPLGTDVKITLDFGEGVTREYYAIKIQGKKGLPDGQYCRVEFCHPDFGEYIAIQKFWK